MVGKRKLGGLAVAVAAFAGVGISSAGAADAGPDFRTVAAGARHACAITDTGELYCWGDDGRGQLGNGSDLGDTRPRRVDLPGRVWMAALGADFACAMAGG